jgi:prepilin-type N-terminal cleavage/methylation domain-containing protein
MLIRITSSTKCWYEYVRNIGGFTLLETMLAILIFSVALLGMSSVSISIVKSNVSSKHFVEASVLAQTTLETLRKAGFSLGADGILGTADDVIPQALTNANTANDTVTNTAALFASPDHAYAVLAGGVEDTNTIIDSPTLSPTATLRRAWVVKDNVPSLGMKTVTVIVAWQDGNMKQYVTVSTAIQGQ